MELEAAADRGAHGGALLARVGEAQRFTNSGRRLVDISPDGTQLTYVANRQLYLRSMPELEARPIAGTESPAAVTVPCSRQMAA